MAKEGTGTGYLRSGPRQWDCRTGEYRDIGLPEAVLNKGKKQGKAKDFKVEQRRKRTLHLSASANSAVAQYHMPFETVALAKIMALEAELAAYRVRVAELEARALRRAG